MVLIYIKPILFNKKYYNIFEKDTFLKSQFKYIGDIIPWENNDKLYILNLGYGAIKIYNTKNGEIIYKTIKMQEENNYLKDENYCAKYVVNEYYEKFLYSKKNKNYLFISNRIGIIQVYDLNIKYVCSINNLTCMHIDPYSEEEKDELGYPHA